MANGCKPARPHGCTAARLQRLQRHCELLRAACCVLSAERCESLLGGHPVVVVVVAVVVVAVVVVAVKVAGPFTLLACIRITCRKVIQTGTPSRETAVLVANHKAKGERLQIAATLSRVE